GLSARDVSVPDPASRSALVLDDDPLSQCCGEMGGEGAGRVVGDAARRKRHHDGDRARRLRFFGAEAMRGERKCCRRKRKRERELQQLRAVCHSLLPRLNQFVGWVKRSETHHIRQSLLCRCRRQEQRFASSSCEGGIPKNRHPRYAWGDLSSSGRCHVTFRTCKACKR